MPLHPQQDCQREGEPDHQREQWQGDRNSGENLRHRQRHGVAAESQQLIDAVLQGRLQRRQDRHRNQWGERAGDVQRWPFT